MMSATIVFCGLNFGLVQKLVGLVQKLVGSNMGMLMKLGSLFQS